MVKPEWGKKHSCPSCGVRFYDMQKSVLTCPRCGAKVKPDQQRLRRGSKLAGAKLAKSEPKPKPEVQIEKGPVDVTQGAVTLEKIGENLGEDGGQLIEDSSQLIEDSSELIEDTSDLAGEDDDMSEVMGHMDEGNSQ